MSVAYTRAARRPAPAFCAWCGTEMPPQQRGRPRKFCSRSCRQRSYEQRSAQGSLQGATASGGEAGALSDQLFEVRCAAEDVVTAIDDNASAEQLREMATELVRLAHRAEQLGNR